MNNFNIEVEEQEFKLIWKMKIRKSKGFWRASLVGLPIAAISEFKGQVIYDLKEKAYDFFEKIIGGEIKQLGFEA